MENKLIKKIKIENFKKFESLEVDNLSLVNIITGDNNVGKTCFLESLLIDKNFTKTLVHLNLTLGRRGYYFPIRNIGDRIEFSEHNYFSFVAKSIDREVFSQFIYEDGFVENIKMKYIPKLKIGGDIVYRIDDLQGIDVKGWLKQSYNDQKPEIQFLYYSEIVEEDYTYIPFTSFNLSYSNDIADFLNELDRIREEEEKRAVDINYDHKREVIDTMNEIMTETLNDYQVIDVSIRRMLGVSLKEKHNGKFIPITQLGDGFQKIFRYVVEVIYAKERGESRLMIDEIDTGIHYSKMESFWRAFIKLVEKYNIQVFATTHSKGCIDAFVKVLNDAEKSNLGRIVSLQQEEDKEKAYTYFTENLDTNFDYRG